MKKLFSIVVLLILSNQVHAIWSSFALVTKDTQSEYGIDIKSSFSKKSGLCTLKFGAVGYPGKHAWLIRTSAKLSTKEQELRTYILGGADAPKSLQLKTKISALGADATRKEKSANFYYEVTVNIGSGNSTYIYIDFPRMVFDGGYYYSIDVDSYCK